MLADTLPTALAADTVLADTVLAGRVLADSGLFLGKNLLAWLLLALGGAMLFGNLLAVIRPPANPKDGELARAPVRRSLIMAALGAIAAVWALASLLR